jgi:hypothetical protein
VFRVDFITNDLICRDTSIAIVSVSNVGLKSILKTLIGDECFLLPGNVKTSDSINIYQEIHKL